MDPKRITDAQLPEDSSRKIPGFSLKNYPGTVIREQAPQDRLTLEFAKPSVDPKAGKESVGVILTNKSGAPVSVLDTEPKCCSGSSAPWSPSVQLPVEIESGQSVRLLEAPPERFLALKALLITLTTREIGSFSWQLRVVDE